MIDALQKIIAGSIYAPSGDNSQPWRFEIDKDIVTIFNLPDQDLTLYNFEQRGSYVAHGALIETMAIIAAEEGCRFEVTYFPEGVASDCVARLVFSSTPRVAHPFYSFIRSRATNRKRYGKTPLSPEQRTALFSAVPAPMKLTLVEDVVKKQALATALTVNERLLLENKILHDFLFTHIRWNEAEEKKYKSGLYAKTLELAPPKLFMFKLCRNWSLLQILNKLGLSKLIAKDNASVFAASPALGAVTIEQASPKAFVEAGRAIQRLWLTATSLGLGFQPVTALPYLAQRVSAGAGSAFTSGQEEMIRQADAEVRRALNIATETIAMSFRVGQSTAPSAFSSRLDPQVIVR